MTIVSILIGIGETIYKLSKQCCGKKQSENTNQLELPHIERRLSITEIEIKRLPLSRTQSLKL